MAGGEGAVGRGRTAEGHVVAAARTGMGAVEMERLGAEASGAGIGVDAVDDVDELGPGGGRMDVDLDDPGVSGDDES